MLDAYPERRHRSRRDPLRHRPPAARRARLLRQVPGPHPVREGLVPARASIRTTGACSRRTDEYFDYYRDYHAFWKLYGIDLPDAVLKKVYYDNALRRGQRAAEVASTPTSAAYRLLFRVVRRAAAGADDVFLLDPVDVELRRRFLHPPQHVVEVELGRFREADRVDARDDERAQIRAGEAALLQLVDDRGDLIVDREDQPAATASRSFSACGSGSSRKSSIAAQHRL